MKVLKHQHFPAFKLFLFPFVLAKIDSRTVHYKPLRLFGFLYHFIRDDKLFVNHTQAIDFKEVKFKIRLGMGKLKLDRKYFRSSNNHFKPHFRFS